MEAKTSNSTSVVHTVKRSGRSADNAAIDADQRIDEKIQQKLLAAVSQSVDQSQLINQIIATLRDVLGLQTITYQSRDSRDALTPAGDDDLSGSLPHGAIDKLIVWGNETATAGCLQYNDLSGAHQWRIITAPVILRDRSPEVLCAAVHARTQSAVSVAAALQLGASHITLWHELQNTRHAKTESRNSAALLELLAKLEESENLTKACYCLVNDAREYLDCQRVVLGLTDKNRVDGKLVAVSGLSNFDKRSELTRVIEAALNESMLRSKLTVLPRADSGQSEGTLAHEKLKAAVNAESLISAPLLNQDDEVVGAWLFVNETSSSACAEQVGFVRASQKVLGTRLSSIRKSEMNPLLRPFKAIMSAFRSRKLVFAVMTLLLILGVLLIPMSYRIGCDCQLEPVLRRFVAAPYDGTLQKSLVEAGDIVTKGQVLARMDARELRWELAGLDADYKSEQKARDAAAARDEVAVAQQSDLEMQRLKLKMQLIRHRLENLEVKSPIDGVVITGDLKKSEGAPLQIGQSIFEIGPLDQMIVEVAVPERDVLHVAAGMDVELQLDAALRQTEAGTIARIFPRAETREAESVYIAEVYLPNLDGRLRPGMKGTAKIVGQNHALGWILFHKAWESFAMLIGC